MNVESAIVQPDWTIRQVMDRINRNSLGLAVVVDEEGKLLRTITDGDIRRAILNRLDLDQPIRVLPEPQHPTGQSRPVTAQVGASPGDLLGLMSEFSIRHVPIVDPDGQVVDISLLEDLVKEDVLPITAVVMAGGFGTRLHPLTETLPKPMLPVGDGPILERIVEQLRQAGIRRLNLATHYKREVIAEHFGDGSNFGVEIEYIEEDQPLGTAGALGQLQPPDDEPLLVMNGDILTRVDFRAMLRFHKEHGADMTVGVRQHEFEIPFGVIEADGAVVSGIVEKPVFHHLINAGVYLLNPGVCRLVPPGQPFDMPDLITKLIAEGGTVVGFPVTDYWLDIGQRDDYEKAQADVQSNEA